MKVQLKLNYGAVMHQTTTGSRVSNAACFHLDKTLLESDAQIRLST